MWNRCLYTLLYIFFLMMTIQQPQRHRPLHNQIFSCFFELFLPLKTSHSILYLFFTSPLMRLLSIPYYLSATSAPTHTAKFHDRLSIVLFFPIPNCFLQPGTSPSSAQYSSTDFILESSISKKDVT